jgi:hypothetical protein
VYSANMYPITFLGGDSGAWTVERMHAVKGDELPRVTHLDTVAGTDAGPRGAVWSLRGVAGHARYVEKREKVDLDGASPPLARPEATMGALIPIRKSAAWWALAQDERRAIFEGKSGHIRDTMKYLPRVARRLYHARDLGESFDFLTWFEFAPEHAGAFDELLAMLREREEWRYVEREVEIRVRRG